MCSDCTKDTKPFTKEQYNKMKLSAESLGFRVATKWRKGLKHMKLGEIVLSEASPSETPSPPKQKKA